MIGPHVPARHLQVLCQAHRRDAHYHAVAHRYVRTFPDNIHVAQHLDIPVPKLIHELVAEGWRGIERRRGRPAPLSLSAGRPRPGNLCRLTPKKITRRSLRILEKSIHWGGDDSVVDPLPELLYGCSLHLIWGTPRVTIPRGTYLRVVGASHL